MKKWLMLFVMMVLLASPAFAEGATAAVDMNSVIAQVIVGLLLVIVPVLGGLVGKLIVKAIKQSQTKIDDRLAAIAVAWANDACDKGKKLDGAIDKLVVLSKGKISKEQAEILVRASYQNLMGELSPLKNQ